MTRAAAVVAVMTAMALGGGLASSAAASATTAPGAVSFPWPGPSGGPGGTAKVTTGGRAADPHQVILPDVFAVAPHGITAAQLARIGKLRYVRNVITFDGGRVGIDGHAVSIIGVDPAQFGAWTPPQTAAVAGIWTALARGRFVTTAAVARQLGLRRGKSYRIAGARQPAVTFGGTATLGIPGVDAVVGVATSRELGLVRHIGVLISAPGASLTSLDAQVRGVLGARAKFVSLRQEQTADTGKLPVDGRVPGGRPDSYLALFRDSAALYCPGLSWTVLAAIGQIESADGQNVGPSSAGALGPMQFIPATWARWGIDAFGETGPPNVMDPYDAVPSAAEYLCANGAALGGASLYSAVFAYNHAKWYVDEVLALAQEYGREYG